MNFIFQGDKQIQTNNVVGVQNVTQLQRNIENVIGKRDELNKHIGGYNGNISYQNFKLENMFNNISLQKNDIQQSNTLTYNSNIVRNDNPIIKDSTDNKVISNSGFQYQIQPNMIHSSLLNFNEKLRQEELNKINEIQESKEENKDIEKSAVQEIIDKMESHSDPRMKSSSFLSFMKSLNNKEITLNEQDNTITNNTNPIPNEEKMNEIWNKISSTIDNMPISTFTQPPITNNVNQQGIEEIDISSLFEKAKQLIDNNNDSMALSLLNKIIKKDPTFYQAYLLSSLCNLNEGSEQEAIKSILLYLKHNPIFTSLYTKESASNIYLSPDYVDYSLDPEKIDYSSSLSYSSYEKNKSNVYNSIITFLSNPSIQKNNDILLVTALSYLGIDNHKQVEETFLEMIKNNPQDYSAYNRLGAFYANNKNYTKAIEMYNKALSIKPDCPRLLINMGISLMNLEDYSNSARHFIKALKLNNNIEEAWNYLTGIFLSMERGDLINKIASRDLNSLDF